jgi:hypothetical protein
MFWVFTGLHPVLIYYALSGLPVLIYYALSGLPVLMYFALSGLTYINKFYPFMAI